MPDSPRRRSAARTGRGSRTPIQIQKLNRICFAGEPSSLRDNTPGHQPADQCSNQPDQKNRALGPVSLSPLIAPASCLRPGYFVAWSVRTLKYRATGAVSAIAVPLTASMSRFEVNGSARPAKRTIMSTTSIER